MSDPFFFTSPVGLTLGRIIEATGARAADGVDLERMVTGVQPLDRGGPGDLVFLDNAKYAKDLARTRATACLVSPKHAAEAPAGVVALVTPQPYHAFARVLALMFPAAVRPQSLFGAVGVAPGAVVHPTARLEENVIVDPLALVGPGAEIGSGTVICAGAVVGPSVRIGRDCAIGANASIQHALIGNRVIVHPGARIGQDGFGFAMGPTGHLKVPQIGRVIIQDDVEIGANTAIDRGANRDTVIGEGTKIDNLVMIAHNVVIGRHCVIVGQVGISGSTTLEDFVVLAGQAGLVGHVTIGMGAQVGAQAGVMNDVAPGARVLGSPARPGRQFFREVATLEKLAAKGDGHGDAGRQEDGRGG
ncbi:MAG: UDP-3-O-(3-hydroxymyristoyl)glucosamine N-acyltransferase [Rhizobiales bacterium 65-9]|nr:UDP-3-O-(3-hydroxymyristoyl)glucosamine N-acyltransferase [Hyphomicrobiales bacterium]OJY35375.1 MAG: UDP-3-O-(3-hydroxymyristoyl)glucosamine N-acyltransferase [Rhizobiales bacterium 65-9]